MSVFRVLTADDDAIARDKLRSAISLDRDCELAGEARNGAEAIRLVEETGAGMLFLGARLPDMSGFDVLRAVAHRKPVVVLTSDDARDAVRAFGEQVFDYLVKPLDSARARESLRRAKAQITRITAAPDYSDAVDNLFRMKRRIAVRGTGRVIIINPEEVDWIEAADNYVCLHCGAETHILRETMNELEKRLDPTRFVRVHRSAIVNIDCIRELQPWFRGDYRVILRDGTELTLTKSHRGRLDSQLLLGSLAS